MTRSRSSPANRHHAHCVVFRVDEPKNTVYVVRVYHGARHPLTRDEIDPQDED